MKKKVIKVWIVVQGEQIPLGTVLEQYGDCLCRSSTYSATPVFKTKTGAEDYRASGQTVVRASLIISLQKEV